MTTKSLTTILVLAILIWGCGKDEFSNLQESQEEEKVEEETEDNSPDDDGTDDNQAPGEVEEPNQQESGLVYYEGRIPTENSKVPSCKSGTPDSVIFIITDSTGVVHEENVPATENSGLVSTTTPASMPKGLSIVNEILLMQGNDTLYALPNQDELDLARFADVTVPFEVEVTDSIELEGSAFCYTQETIDIPDDVLVDGGFGTQRLQTLWIDVEGECIDIITVTIDAFRVLELYPFQDGLYDIPIPENYDRMDIRAYTPEFQGGVNDFQVETFTSSEPYNADGILDTNDLVKFSYDCPLEESPDEDF